MSHFVMLQGDIKPIVEVPTISGVSDQQKTHDIDEQTTNQRFRSSKPVLSGSQAPTPAVTAILKLLDTAAGILYFSAGQQVVPVKRRLTIVNML